MREINRGPKGRASDKAIIAKRREKVTEFLLEKMSYREMADRLQVAISTIHKDVKAVFREWREYRVTNVEEIILYDIANKSYVINEAREQWELSKNRMEVKKGYHSKQISETTKKPKRGAVPSSIYEKTLPPEYNYLKIIVETGDSLVKLVGAIAPQKHEIEVDDKRKVEEEYKDKPVQLIQDAQKLLNGNL